MRLGRIISSLCCVEETNKTVTPFPENRFFCVLFSRFPLLQLFHLDLEEESCSLSSIETRLLGFPGQASWPVCSLRSQSAADHLGDQTLTRG